MRLIPRVLSAALSAPKREQIGPVRVCFLIDTLSRAGTETQLLALIRGLDRSRVEPFLCLLDGSDPESQALEPTNCPILRLGLRKLIHPSTLPAIARLASFWRRHRIDIVQTYFLDSTYLGVPLARLCGIRKVVRVRNNLGYWMTRRHRWLGRCMSALTNRTLTNSDAGRHALVEKEGVASWKVEVIENGVDLSRFENHPATDTSRSIVRVGTVANLRPVKNIDGLIRAATLMSIRFPQLRFEVAGDGPQRAELEALITQRALAGRFSLLGSVADIPAFLARQDIAILPSHSEGMSNALLEYMASGRAIVATNVGANGRLITHGEHGLLVPPGDETAMIRAVERLMRDPLLTARLGRQARERVVREFSRAAMCRRFEEFYVRLARG